MNKLFFFGLFVLTFCFNGCYSFKGISIPPEVNTYYVGDFTRTVPNAPADLEDILKDGLIDRVRRESRLNFDEANPDIEFKGVIKKYITAAETPQQGSVVTQNKLTLSVEIEYISNLDEEDNWKNTFSEFDFFSSDQNLSDVEDELIQTLVDRLTEEIFSRSFTNW